MWLKRFAVILPTIFLARFAVDGVDSWLFHASFTRGNLISDAVFTVIVALLLATYPAVFGIGSGKHAE